MNLRKTARGQQCMVRIPGVCNHDTETTVLAHINGGGMGMKNSDLKSAFCSAACHDVIDFRVKSDFSREQLILWHWEGVGRTLDIWEREGLIKIKG